MVKKRTEIRPFVKWAGGKKQLLKQFENYYPLELKNGSIKTYYEPFLGGGAVFFDLIQKYDIKQSYLFDLNEDLILIYKVIQSDVESLLCFLEKQKQQYLKLNEKDRAAYFYEIRKIYNETKRNINYEKFSENWFPRASQMLFLNKTCFNGLYRTNKRGEFNVPFGKHKNPQIFKESNLKNISMYFQNVEFAVADFGELENITINNSFIYFDPPYRPITRTSYFTTYHKKKFDDHEQIRLAWLFKALNRSGNKLMLSNSDPKNENQNDCFFEEHYAGFNIQRINANRSINCKGSKRGKINELLIMNY